MEDGGISGFGGSLTNNEIKTKLFTTFIMKSNYILKYGSMENRSNKSQTLHMYVVFWPRNKSRPVLSDWSHRPWVLRRHFVDKTDTFWLNLAHNSWIRYISVSCSLFCCAIFEHKTLKLLRYQHLLVHFKAIRKIYLMVKATNIFKS